MGIAPCLDPAQLVKKEDSVPENSYRYHLENIPATCKSTMNERPDEDDRYTALSTVEGAPRYSELEVQEASGVL